MPKMVCVKCQVELRIEKNGVIVAERFQNNTKIYKLWDADLWKCPLCRIEIIGGFAQQNFAEHYKDNCEALVEQFKAKGVRVIDDNELVTHGLTESV